MKLNELANDLANYVLSDSKEVDDFVENCCETRREAKLIREYQDSDAIKIPPEVKEIMMRHQSHAYSLACLLKELILG